MKELLNNKIFTEKDELAKQFRSAPFFPHIRIDDFFDISFCHKLADEFPSFDQGFEQNEQGYLNKAYARRVRHDDIVDLCCREDITSMGSNYEELDKLFSSEIFLKYMSHITGIPDLIYDPEYIGGGTHENLNGAQLDPHVDFNYHPNKKWHRRLNIIFFLNEEWNKEWGGHFEVHKDPWSKDDNEIISFVPRLNSCVIFATGEHSWHGFNKITFPENCKISSRKTIALYFYSKERPEIETAPSHSTVYIPRNIPLKIQEGAILTKEDVEYLTEIFERRNSIIKFLYKREKEFNSTLDSLKKAVSCRIPLIGFIKQTDEAVGLYEDKWVGSNMKFNILTIKDTDKVIINGWLPDCLKSLTLTLHVNEDSYKEKVSPGLFLLEFPLSIKANTKVSISVLCCSTFIPSTIQESGDIRELSFKLEDFTFL